MSRTTPTSCHCAIALAQATDHVAVTPVLLRSLAASDIDEAAGHYRRHAGKQTALDFIDAIERAVRQIGHNPGIGNLRYGYELDIPNLRAWPVARFPYVMFYIVSDKVVDVWRVLHTRRDIPETLRDPTM